ncbi:hypothetical protein OIE66_39535 [Nonomuraea sp. NBC_01738]|uniref:MauE/DoxX family redox-associated membrane protein n=1 Tax=Nonomuraea sp. NBC_01738 TaxID=2976003 RepID=UPI002E14E2F0|nr:hypothetical protein OIE66_39535 [Nonomuraea sp. NBC_01738]
MLESQLPVLIVLLVLSSGAKLVAARSGGEPGSLTRLGPAALVPERWQAGALVTCAAGELALAGGLLLSTHALFRWWTVVFFALSTYVLLELRRRRPDAGCGCFGEVSGAPVGLRSVGRTLVLTGMALLSVWAPVPGWAAYGSPAWAIAAGVIVLAVLSPEIEETVERIRYRAPCEQRPAPEEGVTLSRLRASSTWRGHRDELAVAEPYDSWRELCWRFFAFKNHDGDDIVFAVYLAGRRPAVRMALVSTESMPEYTTV